MASGANNLRNALLPAVDLIRGIPAILGMRLFTVSVVYRTWSGSRVGLGTATTSAPVAIKVGAGGNPIGVKQVRQRDIFASGGILQDQDLAVGPITPPYTGSTKDDDQISVFDPPIAAPPTEVLFFVTGPGYSAGTWFKKVYQDVSKNYHYTVYIRKIGTNTP